MEKSRSAGAALVMVSWRIIRSGEIEEKRFWRLLCLAKPPKPRTFRVRIFIKDLKDWASIL